VDGRDLVIPEKRYQILEPQSGDEVAIGPMQLQAWRESYLRPDLGATTDAIEAARGMVATQAGDQFRAALFLEARANPERIWYRVVKDEAGAVVGFIHGVITPEANVLEAIYLLDVLKGEGVGDELMQGFLAWRDASKPTTLEVIAFNDRALNFYTKYGFAKSVKEPVMFAGVFPVVEMSMEPN